MSFEYNFKKDYKITTSGQSGSGRAWPNSGKRDMGFLEFLSSQNGCFRASAVSRGEKPRKPVVP